MKVHMHNNIGAESVSFGAGIADIPRLKSIKSKQINLKSLELKGYTAFIGGDVYTPQNKILKQNLLFKNARVIAINDFDENTISEPIQYVILDNQTITPGILDEHIHGGYGINFHNSPENKIRELLKIFKEQGTAAVVATTLPGKKEDIKNQIKILNNIINNQDNAEAKVYGIHLEGPFLSPDKSGIHPADMLMLPTIENFKELEPENVKIVTLAPERIGGKELAKFLTENNIIASAGHTMAMAADIINAGIKQVTHIFNAMSPFHHRNESVVNEALWNNEIMVEMNSDQSLLKPKTMDLIMRVKPKDKITLISDALPEAGIKKDFIMNGVKIHVKDNWEAISDEGVLAGSMQFLHNLAKHLVETTEMSFADFIRFASINPSKNLHAEKDFQIKKGAKPNFTIWDNKTLKPEKTFTI